MRGLRGMASLEGIAVSETIHTMSKATLKALRGSIAKWEKIVAGTGVDKGPDNCALCKRFFYRDCSGCPVNDKTGEGCQRTPYDRWADVTETETDMTAAGHRKAVSPEAKEAAQAELDFLKSLLPEAQTDETVSK